MAALAIGLSMVSRLEGVGNVGANLDSDCDRDLDGRPDGRIVPRLKQPREGAELDGSAPSFFRIVVTKQNCRECETDMNEKPTFGCHAVARIEGLSLRGNGVSYEFLWDADGPRRLRNDLGRSDDDSGQHAA
jgi:hypothetical protein